jgi:hypothetical protein
VRVTVYLLDGGSLEVHDMAPDNVAELVTEWRDGEAPVFAFTLEDTAVSYVARAAVARIDVE